MTKTMIKKSLRAYISCSELEHIFAPLFSVEASLRLPLLKLKVLELLIYLSCLKPREKELTQYFSEQTERAFYD